MPKVEIISDVFSSRLRQCRGSRNKANFAFFLGLAAPTYHRYEAGRIPKPEILHRIARRCDTTPEWLLGGVADGFKLGESDKKKWVLRETTAHYGAASEAKPIADSPAMARLRVAAHEDLDRIVNAAARSSEPERFAGQVRSALYMTAGAMDHESDSEMADSCLSIWKRIISGAKKANGE